VQLENGALGRFHPVSCGGSCAPASLWWQQDGAEYTIQVRLPLGTAVPLQKKVLLQVANAMVRVRTAATGQRGATARAGGA
jgi:hypothetical protein